MFLELLHDNLSHVYYCAGGMTYCASLFAGFRILIAEGGSISYVRRSDAIVFDSRQSKNRPFAVDTSNGLPIAISLAVLSKRHL